jgi:hypothetical protein
MDAKQALQKAIDRQESEYAVIVDGNRHHLSNPIRTKKQDITIDRCREICNKIESHFGITIRKIEISLTQWDLQSLTPKDYELVLSNDIGVNRIGPDKSIVYDNKENCFQIWENGLPIYEDNNGVICDDQDALADCLL